LILESILETKAATILQFIGGLRASLLVTFEEGTSAAWLYDLLKPHVANVLVCDPRKNALLKDGSKSDRIDARKLAELLRGFFVNIPFIEPPISGRDNVVIAPVLNADPEKQRRRCDGDNPRNSGAVQAVPFGCSLTHLHADHFAADDDLHAPVLLPSGNGIVIGNRVILPEPFGRDGVCR